ncbi:MAG: hypothetical protein RIB84_01015 [Sneathiellaceae bacterium]
MADAIATAFRLPHHLWLRVRVHAVATRRDVTDVVSEALENSLADWLQEPPPQRPSGRLDRLRRAAAKLAELEALATLYANHDGSTRPPRAADEALPAPAGGFVREAHLQMHPDRLTQLRPKLTRRLWKHWRAWCLYTDSDPNEAARRALEAYLGYQIPAGGQATEAIREALAEVRHTLDVLLSEPPERSF